MKGQREQRWRRTRVGCALMPAARCAPALCGGKPDDLDAGTASRRLNFLAARLNGTESPQNDRQSGEYRINRKIQNRNLWILRPSRSLILVMRCLPSQC